jgi:hypothetical protein
MSQYNPDPSQFSKLKGKVVVLTGMYYVSWQGKSSVRVPLPRLPPASPPSSVFGAKTPTLGGANGIGAATVRLLHEAGASIVFGDLATKAAEALLSSLSNPSTITFLPTDVTKYADNIALFKTALQKYGSVE